VALDKCDQLLETFLISLHNSKIAEKGDRRTPTGTRQNSKIAEKAARVIGGEACRPTRRAWRNGHGIEGAGSDQRPVPFSYTGQMLHNMSYAAHRGRS
jgi:hypothetical protein